MKKIMDERITKETNALAANVFWLTLILQAIVLAAKLLLGAALRVCILDIAVLAVGFVGMILFRSIKGLWGAKDEALREIEQAGLAQLFITMFAMLLIGEFLLVFMDEENLLWYMPFLLVWGLPTAIFTVKSTRRGLMVWGSQKAETDGKARLLKGSILGALFFGIVMGGPNCFKDGAFNPAGLIEVFTMGAFWGVMFYWGMRLMMKRSEKAADKAVAAAEEQADEE